MLDRVRGRVVAHFRARHELYWAPAVYVAALLFIYRAVFFGEGPQQGLGWDTIESYWPDLAYLSDQIRLGEWPLWNPYERGGYPDIGLPERGIYYPVNWLLAGSGALIGETSWWLGQLKGFGHHLLAALMMHLYLRRRGLPRAAAVVGGLAWLASAPLLIHKASSVIWPMTWVPLLWLAIDAVAARPDWRRGALLGGALALAGHAGSAPGFFYALLLALPYGALRAGQALWDTRGTGEARLRGAELRRALLRRAGRMALALGVGLAVTLGLLLVTVAPSLELTALSQRAERTLAYALESPLPVAATLRGLVAPAAGAYDMHVGILVLALATIAVAAAPRRDRWAVALFAAMAVFFLILAFGTATPVLRFLVEHVPGFDLFRVSSRYKLLVAPLLAVLAAHGAAVLLATRSPLSAHPERSAPEARGAKGQSGMRVLLVTCVVLLILAGLILWAVLAVDLPRRPPLPSRHLPLLLLAIAATLILATLLLPRRFALLAAAAMAVPIAWEPQHIVHFSNKALERRVDHLEDRAWLEGLADVEREWRIWDEFVMEQRAGSRLRVREMRSYPAGGSLETERYRRIVSYAAKHPELLQAFSIRYVFHRGHHRAGLIPNHFKRPLDQLAPRHYRRLTVPECERRRIRACPVFEALHPVPAVSWYGAAAIEGRGGGKLLDLLRRQLDQQGELRVAALEPEAAARLADGPLPALLAGSTAPPPAVAGRVVELGANRMEVEIDAPAAGLVVVNDAMYPGWKVDVDGEPAPPVIANWWARGVAVGPGHHTIVWRFEPGRHRTYSWLFTLSFLLVVAAALLPRRRSRTAVLPSRGE